VVISLRSVLYVPYPCIKEYKAYVLKPTNSGVYNMLYQILLTADLFRSLLRSSSG